MPLLRLRLRCACFSSHTQHTHAWIQAHWQCSAFRARHGTRCDSLARAESEPLISPAAFTRAAPCFSFPDASPLLSPPLRSPSSLLPLTRGCRFCLALLSARFAVARPPCWCSACSSSPSSCCSTSGASSARAKRAAGAVVGLTLQTGTTTTALRSESGGWETVGPRRFSDRMRAGACTQCVMLE